MLNKSLILSLTCRIIALNFILVLTKIAEMITSAIPYTVYSPIFIIFSARFSALKFPAFLKLMLFPAI